MKKLIFTLFLIIPLYLSTAQINDTLKYFKNHGQVYFNVSAYTSLQCARFEPSAPCYIKSVTILFSGSTGTCRLRLFGYEAGDQIPDLRNDIIPPIKITKTIQNNQSITVNLPKPVKFDNSWFWIAIDSMSSGMFLLSDNVNVDSIPYNTYYYQAIRVPNADPTKVWGVAPYAFYISVAVTYPEKVSPRFLRDSTALYGIKEEALSSCIAAADYDNDGYIDLMLNNKLYRNINGRSFEDVTQKYGIINNHNPNIRLIDSNNKTQCYSFVDINNDGLLDIINYGYDTSMVFINNGDSFTPKFLSLPGFHTYSYSPLLFNWADLNYDGYPDLVALQQASKYDPNAGPDILPSFVFINNKNNDFVDESERIFPKGHVFRRARASQFGDINNDGYPDLYIANYFLERDELYLNDGTGHFTDVAPQKALDINKFGSSMHGSGVNMFDYDNDGDLDIMVARIAHSRFVTDYDHQGSALYRNEGAPDYKFTNLTGQYNNYPGQIAPCGLEYEDYHSSADFADVNNDGLPDLLLKTYNPYRFISFYEQQTDHTFQMKRFEYGLDRLDCYGPGQVWVDIDNDGKLDLINYCQSKVQVFKNTLRNGLKAVELDLRCKTGNKFAIGARAYVYFNNKVFMREVVCGQDESVQYPYRLHFGLGVSNAENNQKIDSIVVLWPTKPQKRDVYRNLETYAHYTLTEGGSIDFNVMDVKPPVVYNLKLTAYPNPFVDRSVISYSLTEPAFVVLKIYDGLGNEIQTLVNEMKNPGDYQATFNANGLPSGSYYYNLQIGNQAQTNSLILIK